MTARRDDDARRPQEKATTYLSASCISLPNPSWPLSSFRTPNELRTRLACKSGRRWRGKIYGISLKGGETEFPSPCERPRPEYEPTWEKEGSCPSWRDYGVGDGAGDFDFLPVLSLYPVTEMGFFLARAHSRAAIGAIHVRRMGLSLRAGSHA